MPPIDRRTSCSLLLLLYFNCSLSFDVGVFSNDYIPFFLVFSDVFSWFGQESLDLENSGTMPFKKSWIMYLLLRWVISLRCVMFKYNRHAVVTFILLFDNTILCIHP